jgi:SNF2 family DNA or RNA helicase
MGSLLDWLLLLDDMGTGKTVQAIKAIEKRAQDGKDPFPALIVCPNSMVRKWRSEFNFWFPEARVEILDGSRVKKLKAIERIRTGESDVLVANWEALRHHSRLAPYGSVRLQGCKVCDPAEKREQRLCARCPKELNEIEWHSIIADEAHRAKDPKAQQTRALWALRTEKTTFRVVATGTFIANDPGDAWAQLHFASPISFPAKTKYTDRYLETSFNPFGGMDILGLKEANKAEFFSIIDPHLLRRSKEEVLPQLPPKMYEVREVDMTPKQKKAYDQMVATMVAEMENGDHAVAVDPIVMRTRLLQFSSATGADVQVSFAPDPVTGEMKRREKVILDEPSNKIDALMDILDETGSPRTRDGRWLKPVVVFAQSTQLIELASKRLEKAGIPHGLVTGNVSTIERQMHVDAFQEGKYQAILCQVQAGGTGITLTAADTLVFIQNTDSSVDRKQAEDRIHRIGSEVHSSVHIIDIRSIGTIEENQEWNLAMKQGRLQELLRDKDRLLALLKKKSSTGD